jgi:SAM-dependent methyltransferase
MCKKYGLFFFFFILAQSAIAVQSYKNETEYFAHVNVNLPKILIVGSGRGTVSGCPNYAFVSYRKPTNYLLVNYTAAESELGSGTQPDIDCNILELYSSGKFTAEAYDCIIFENVDYGYSFSRKAIKGALNLLKPGGFLVSSTFPSPFHMQKVTPDDSWISINAGKLLYKENASGKNEGTPYIWWPNEFYPDKLGFLNGNKEIFKTFLEIETLANNIEFKTVKGDSKFWPQLADQVDVVIIQKIGCGTDAHHTFLEEDVDTLTVDVTEQDKKNSGGCC